MVHEYLSNSLLTHSFWHSVKHVDGDDCGDESDGGCDGGNNLKLA